MNACYSTVWRSENTCVESILSLNYVGHIDQTQNSLNFKHLPLLSHLSHQPPPLQFFWIGIIF